MKHKFITSKMKKGKPLEKDPILSRHVPKTKWYDATTLTKMLKKFHVVYIKPDRGSSGTGIIQVKRLNDSESLLSFKASSKTYPNTQIAAEVAKRMRRGKKYIVQQGISLATYRKKPFDMRIVLQKPSKKWILTWMSAKVASRSNAIVTNVAKGARDAKIEEVLRGVDQPLNVPAVLKELKIVSYKVARKLGSRFPVRIVGLDMAIDKKGKIWFIEANTNPSFHGLKKFDPVQYKRYLRAKKQIKANS